MILGRCYGIEHFTGQWIRCGNPNCGGEATKEDGILPGKPPKDKKFFDSLKNVPEKTLIQLGLRQWKRGHWLYPGEWYDSIPEGYPVVDIFGETELFEHGKTDDDIRFGCLAYGFIKNDGNSEKGNNEYSR